MAEMEEAVRKRAAAADLWERTLGQIPAVFGRMVYLAGLRDSNTGTYEHHGFIAMFGEAAGEAMRESHEEAFREWLKMGLAEQQRDLELYVAGLEPERRDVVAAWTQIEPYRTLPPAGAAAAERELFFMDLEALLAVMKNESGAS